MDWNKGSGTTETGSKLRDGGCWVGFGTRRFSGAGSLAGAPASLPALTCVLGPEHILKNKGWE